MCFSFVSILWVCIRFFERACFPFYSIRHGEGVAIVVKGFVVWKMGESLVSAVSAYWMPATVWELEVRAREEDKGAAATTLRRRAEAVYRKAPLPSTLLTRAELPMDTLCLKEVVAVDPIVDKDSVASTTVLQGDLVQSTMSISSQADTTGTNMAWRRSRAESTRADRRLRPQ